MNVFIWIDDERPIPAPPFNWGVVVHVHNYEEAEEFLYKYLKYGNTVYVDFDHDLGEGKTGYDVAKWIVAGGNQDQLRYRIHSMNPVGRANIEQLLSHYGYKKF